MYYVILRGISYPKNHSGFEIKPTEGNSLVPIMQDKKWKGHEYLFWEHLGSRAVRQGKWKLVSVPNGSWELYDMDSDRSELKDLSKTFPDKVLSMERQYNSWAAKVGVNK